MRCNFLLKKSAMILDTNLSTEDHIKAVAKKVFIEKGFSATTTRDIAEAANTNLALINYYFRSKEKLFALIFQEVITAFFERIVETLNKDMPLREKLSDLIEKDTDFLLENQDIPVFVMNQLRDNSQSFLSNTIQKDRILNSLMAKQMTIAIENGEMRDMKVHECIVLIVSNMQFLFMAKPLISHLGGINDTEFKNMVLVHKQRIKDMVLDYIFLK